VDTTKKYRARFNIQNLCSECHRYLPTMLSDIGSTWSLRGGWVGANSGQTFYQYDLDIEPYALAEYNLRVDFRIRFDTYWHEAYCKPEQFGKIFVTYDITDISPLKYPCLLKINMPSGIHASLQNRMDSSLLSLNLKTLDQFYIDFKYGQYGQKISDVIDLNDEEYAMLNQSNWYQENILFDRLLNSAKKDMREAIDLVATAIRVADVENYII